MTSAFFSSSWHRVSVLKPRMRSHLKIARHRYLGKVWYVVQDALSGRSHRFSHQSYALIALMDGHRTLDAIWQLAGEQLGEEMPSQDEAIQLLAQLHKADLVQTDRVPDVEEIADRQRLERRQNFWALLKSPMSLKLPLLDPERFLNRTAFMANWLYNKWTGIVWLIAVGWALATVWVNWHKLTENLADRVLGAENLIAIALIYPLLKAVHEMGHAYAVKRWGGEVHEMGIMFLVFMPVPYVDASASISFSNKWQRMLVAAAGIGVELFIAALAMLVWQHADEGLVRTLAFNVALIAGVSTLLFNGNPLLRYDAYYVLSDLIEIPNLGGRSTQQIAYLARRYLLGVREAEPVAQGLQERVWMVAYALTSFVYRMMISFAIAMFVAGKLFFVGVILAVMMLYNYIGRPLKSILAYLWTDKELRFRRPRAMLVAAATSFAGLFLLFGLPVPKMTVAEGVFWLPEANVVMSKSNGFVRDFVDPSGALVAKGTPLYVSTNMDIESRLDVSMGRLKELYARYEAAVAARRAGEAGIQSEEIERAKAELAKALEDKEQLVLRSSAEGRFVPASGLQMEDRFLTRGTTVGYLLHKDRHRIRVAVRSQDVQSVREDVRAIQVRLASDWQTELGARLVVELPSAQRSLPHPLLSVNGGGPFALDPTNPEKMESFEPVFLFDVELNQPVMPHMNERVYVRFEHSPEPLGYRVYRFVRRTVLRDLEF